MQLVWRATGLITYNPTVVFQKILIYSKDKLASDMNTTGANSNALIQTRFFLGAISSTPKNIEQVIEVEELVSLFRN